MTAAVEWRYIEAFAAQFRRCDLQAGEVVVILSESQSRGSLVVISRLAAQSLGGHVIDIVLPTPASAHPVPIRSTGASQAISYHRAAMAALATADLVIDCTVEGLLHAPELGEILGGGARVLMVSNEHPDVFDLVRVRQPTTPAPSFPRAESKPLFLCYMPLSHAGKARRRDVFRWHRRPPHLEKHANNHDRQSVVSHGARHIHRSAVARFWCHRDLPKCRNASHQPRIRRASHHEGATRGIAFAVAFVARVRADIAGWLCLDGILAFRII